MTDRRASAGGGMKAAMGVVLPLLTVLMTVSTTMTAGCGRVPGQFIIVQNQAPQPGCLIPGDLGAAYNPEGVLDISLVSSGGRTGYLLFPLLENDLPGPSGGQLVDGNRIALSGFDVELELTSTPPLEAAVAAFASRPDLVRYFVPTSGSVASGGGHTPALVNAFPADLAVALGGAVPPGSSLDVVTHVRAHGQRVTGSIVSDSFAFPLRICEGCLVASVQTCPVRNPPLNTGNDCNVAQDQVVDCCSTGGGLVCPSVIAQ